MTYVNKLLSLTLFVGVFSWHQGASAGETTSYATSDHLVVTGRIEQIRTHDYSVAWFKFKSHDNFVSELGCTNNLLTMDMTKEDGRAMHRVLIAAKIAEKPMSALIDLKNPCFSYGRRLSAVDLN